MSDQIRAAMIEGLREFLPEKYAKAALGDFGPLTPEQEADLKTYHSMLMKRRLEMALEDLVEATDIPDRNCSCHAAPPCSWCVDYGHISECVETAKRVLKESRNNA